MSISQVTATTPKPSTDSNAKPTSTVIPSPGKTTTDQAVISPAGHAALDKEQAPVASPTVAAAALSQKALQLGKQLQHTNPVDFKKADTNGDGKLSSAEARSAGLM